MQPSPQTTPDTEYRAKLLAIAAEDMDIYARVMRYRSKLVKDTEATAVRGRLRQAVEYAHGALFREISPAEMRYVELRYRHLMPQGQAIKGSGISKTMSEEVLLLARPVIRQIEVVRREMSDAMRVTREDVVQGLMNAVAVARDSQDLVMAWREIGKVLGHYEETKIRIEQNIKQEVNHNHRLSGVDLSVISDADLLNYAGSELLQKLTAPQPRTLEHVQAERLEPAAIQHREPIIHEQPADPDQ